MHAHSATLLIAKVVVVVVEAVVKAAVVKAAVVMAAVVMTAVMMTAVGAAVTRICGESNNQLISNPVAWGSGKDARAAARSNAHK